VVGELRLGLAPLDVRLRQARLERRDRLDLVLELAVDLDEVLGNRVPPPLALLHEPDPGLQPVELVEEVRHRGRPGIKKGVPVGEHPLKF